MNKPNQNAILMLGNLTGLGELATLIENNQTFILRTVFISIQADDTDGQYVAELKIDGVRTLVINTQEGFLIPFSVYLESAYIVINTGMTVTFQVTNAVGGTNCQASVGLFGELHPFTAWQGLIVP